MSVLKNTMYCNNMYGHPIIRQRANKAYAADHFYAPAIFNWYCTSRTLVRPVHFFSRTIATGRGIYHIATFLDCSEIVVCFL